jgi:hypothetical protein
MLRCFFVGNLMSDYEGSRDEFLRLLAEFGEEPAFLARARAPEIALEALMRDCNAHREQLLEGPRVHLSALATQVSGNWGRLATLLAEPDEAGLLEELHTQLNARKSVRPDWLTTDKILLRRFHESAQRFNRSWQNYLHHLDLEPVNQPRREYNEFYVLEKACAFLSERVTDEFEPLTLIDVAYLLQRFPVLKLPRLA